MFNFRFLILKKIKKVFLVFLYLFQKRRLAVLLQLFLTIASINGQAFFSEALEAKKQLEGASIAVKSLMDTLEEAESLLKIEKDFLAYEKELKEFQKTLDEYEKLGLDVKDFVQFKDYDPSSFKEQLDFIKEYVKRAKKLLDSLSDIFKSPEAITASQQIETNRTLRALLEDSQTRELRQLRREIAKEKILLARRKKEQEFINKQYSYINRHSKTTGFGIFHPFTNKNDLENRNKNKNKNNIKPKNQNRKKFLGIF